MTRNLCNTRLSLPSHDLISREQKPEETLNYELFESGLWIVDTADSNPVTQCATSHIESWGQPKLREDAVLGGAPALIALLNISLQKKRAGVEWIWFWLAAS